MEAVPFRNISISFVHIMEPEGNKIELWKPNDEYDKIVGGRTK